MAKLCPKCRSHNVAPNSYFCIQCIGVLNALGTDLREAANKYPYECNTCLLLLEKDFNYCPNCGSSDISERTLFMTPIPASDPIKKWECDGCGNKWETPEDTKTTCCSRCGDDRIKEQ